LESTFLFTDERTFWHSTGVQSLFIPIGDWVQPPTGSFAADTPDSKRRILNLIQASGLTSRIDVTSADPVTRQDLLRIHPKKYIDAFKKMSDAGGGELGMPAFHRTLIDEMAAALRP